MIPELIPVMASNQPHDRIAAFFSLIALLLFLLLIGLLGPSLSNAQPVQTFLQAQIAKVDSTGDLQGVFRVLGTAAGEGFSFFQVEYGAGEFPKSWETLIQSKQAVSSGLLAELKTADLPSGIYAVRLTVKNQDGRTLRDRIVINLEEQRPDLVISGLEVMITNTKIAVTGVLKNNSSHTIRWPFSVDFYLSQKEILDASAIHLGGQRLTSMKANGHFQLAKEFLISEQIRDGDYFLLVVVDHKDEIVEVHEDNNAALAHRQVVLSPDLVMIDLEPSLESAGQTLSLTGKIKNQGNRPVRAPFEVSFFLSSDMSIDNQDVKLADQVLERMEPGSVDSFRLSRPLSDTMRAGTYLILAVVDPKGKIYESNKSNNQYSGSRLILGPDLVITKLTGRISPDGRHITMHDRTMNQGRYPIQQRFKVTYYLSSMAVPPSSDQVLGSREISSLASGESSSADSSFEIRSFAQGTYGIIARADAEKTIPEMARSNNELKGDQIVLGPDLSIREFMTSLLPNGEQIEVHDTVINQGSLPVERSIRIAFYLSRDSQFDHKDQLLGSREIASLDVGEVSSGINLFSLPPQTQLGGSYILARADPEELIQDIQINNNIASAGRLLMKDIDLVVSDLTASLISSGNKMRIKDLVRNLGSQDIEDPFSVAYYLSRDGEIDPDDLLLGERRVEGLKTQKNSSGSTTLAVPPETGIGKLSILARVDSRSEIAERKEDNNDYWGSSLHLGPDLILTELKGEVAPDAHEIVLNYTVKNQGNRPTRTGFKVAFHLSRDQLIRSDDFFLGDQPASSLSPGAVSSGRSAISIPSSLEDGIYHLRGRIDPDQEIQEVEEANNDQWGEPISLGPDLVIEAIQSSLNPEENTILVEDTIRNEGNRPTPGSLEVSYFLSKNWVIDRTDLFLGSRTVGGLGPGELSRSSTTLAFSPKEVATGRYFILARADGGNAVIETNEANNIRPTLDPLIIRKAKK